MQWFRSCDGDGDDSWTGGGGGGEDDKAVGACMGVPPSLYYLVTIFELSVGNFSYY